MVRSHGWYLDYDLTDVRFPYCTNIHTHGLVKFNHLDLQICFPLTQEDAQLLSLTIVDKIKHGTRFTPGIKYKDVLHDNDVEFAEAIEDGRVVLRIIFPDKHGNLRGELKEQWKGCRVYFSNN